MPELAPESTIEEVAALVSQALQAAGIVATLSGGSAVTIYSDNEYLSYDLDFVTSERLTEIEVAIRPLGYERVGNGREFRHPASRWYLEFPQGPLAFGETDFGHDDAAVLETAYGPLRIITPTQVVMDRLAAFVHWNDGQSFDQAVMVARRHPLEWSALREWAARDGIDESAVDRLKTLAATLSAE